MELLTWTGSNDTFYKTGIFFKSPITLVCSKESEFKHTLMD